MPEASRKGRQWTWQRWDKAITAAMGGNYATASILAGMLFLALLGAALVMRAVAPTPQELDDVPLAYAKRLAAHAVFERVNLPECEQAALGQIHGPYKAFAIKTGLYQAEAFPPALACLDDRLREAKLDTLAVQLKSPKNLGVFMELSCSGDLRESDPCERAFEFAKTKAPKVGEAIASALSASGSASR